MNAPLFMIPKNIFENSDYIKLDTGIITAKSYLVPYDQNFNYLDCNDEEQLYDRYDISMAKMSLSINNDVLKDDFHIIKAISYDIAIDNCLAPLHKKFPSARVNIDFDQVIDFQLDLDTLKRLNELKDGLIV